MKYIILMSELGNEYEVFSVKFFQLFCMFEFFHKPSWGERNEVCQGGCISNRFPSGILGCI